MADSAISFEAPDVDLSTGADGGAELDAGGEGAAAGTEGTEGAEATPTESEGDASKPFLAVQNGKLTAAAQELYNKLKVENPKMARAVQRALFAEARLYKEIPGGFKEVAPTPRENRAVGRGRRDSDPSR